MGCSQSRPPRTTTEEEVGIPSMAESGASESITESVSVVPGSSSPADSATCSNQQEGTEQGTWRFLSVTQSKAKKRCCDSYCFVLDYPDCCEHSTMDLHVSSYCRLCQERCGEQNNEKVRKNLILARKLVEETLNNEFCSPCDSEAQNDSHEGSCTEDCPICWEPQHYPCALVCGHTVCTTHLNKLDSCPLCRHPIRSTRRKPSFSEEDLMRRLDDPFADERHPFGAAAAFVRNNNMAQQIEGWQGIVHVNRSSSAPTPTRRRGVGGLIDAVRSMVSR